MAKAKVPTVEFNLLTKQVGFVKSETRETLYAGAVGAGKTLALCVKAYLRASRPGACEGLCRKHLVTFKATTLKTLLDGVGEMPPVLPLGTYTHNKSEKTIRIAGGGVIQYFGLDDEDKIGSYNLSGCGVDQAEELSEDDYTALRGRVRVPVEGLTNQLYSVANPGPPTHHLCRRFGLDPSGNGVAAANCKAIATALTDNPFLPADYVADLMTYTGLARKRKVLGLWAGSEGLVFDTFDRDVFVRERTGPWARVVMGVDWGYTHASAIVVVAKDAAGRRHVLAEYVRQKQTMPQIADAAVKLRETYGVEVTVHDPSAPALAEEMRARGLNVKPANNDVFGGIQTVAKGYVTEGDGTPLQTVSPTCTHLIDEHGLYEWMPGKDKPRKQYDDACDAMRYACMELEGGGVCVRIIDMGGASAPARSDGWDDERMWQTFELNR